jgi:hypothetical protein
MKRTIMQARTERWTPEALGLAPERYAAAIGFLFDRPVPQGQEQEWFWNIDEPGFAATPLEWTRIQTMLFAGAGQDLERFDNEQVGMGLNYVMSNSVSDVPFAAIDASVPLEDAMRMMSAMPLLWRDCIGPRLAHINAPIGSATGRLGFVCYMWFDVWPTFWNVRDQRPWQDAVWNVLREMLAMPYREVQIAALHGIGHDIDAAYEPAAVNRALDAFVRTLGAKDEELRNYAQAARQRCVQ